jgi:formate dehydrogenase subunit beta
MNTVILPENNDVLAALRGFLRQLLESGCVEALFLPLESHNGAIFPALVTDPARLEQADPLAPVMPINGARAVAALTGKQPPARLGAVLRPCELRALVELVKLQQASLEGVTLIGLDCPGTFEVPQFVESGVWEAGRRPESLRTVLSAAQAGHAPDLDGLRPRPACQACLQPLPEGADIQIHLFGVEADGGIPVTLKDELASSGLDCLPGEGLPDSRQVAVERLLTDRQQAREQAWAALQARIDSDGGFPGLFDACVRCHDCMTACPMCYCKTCLFKTAAFDHPPEHYFNAARHKGALRMLGDTLLFHLTRLNHMGTSCVGCGMCTSACPSGIPVGTIFSMIGAQVQATFDYAPGHDLAEPLPLVAFQPDEWLEIGE